jgi:hypothetical protein
VTPLKELSGEKNLASHRPFVLQTSRYHRNFQIL